MAHKEQRSFLDKTKLKFPNAFKNCKVLDIGSFDVMVMKNHGLMIVIL